MYHFFVITPAVTAAPAAVEAAATKDEIVSKPLKAIKEPVAAIAKDERIAKLVTHVKENMEVIKNQQIQQEMSRYTLTFLTDLILIPLFVLQENHEIMKRLDDLSLEKIESSKVFPLHASADEALII